MVSDEETESEFGDVIFSCFLQLDSLESGSLLGCGPAQSLLAITITNRPQILVYMKV